jgi:hypothetical protein
VNRPSIWILGGVFLIVLGVCIAGAILAISANDPDVDVNLGDDEFQIHALEARAESVTERGPLFFNDPTGGNRPLVVNHLGDEPEEGWVAFLAIAPDSEACVVSWDEDDEVIRDCEGTTYPADGEGLEQFPTRVEDGTLYIDLGRGRDDEDEPTTTTTILVTGDTLG